MRLLAAYLVLLAVGIAAREAEAQDAAPVSWPAHSDAILGLSFSPDGKLLLTGSADKSAALSDVEGRKKVRTLSGHAATAKEGVSMRGPGETLAFSPDGTLLACGSGIGAMVYLWNVANRKERCHVFLDSGVVIGLAFSPDGALLACSGGSQAVRIIDTAARKVVRKLEGAPSTQTSVALSPDGSRVATGDMNGHVWVWTVGP